MACSDKSEGGIGLSIVTHGTSIYKRFIMLSCLSRKILSGFGAIKSANKDVKF